VCSASIDFSRRLKARKKMSSRRFFAASNSKKSNNNNNNNDTPDQQRGKSKQDKGQSKYGFAQPPTVHYILDDYKKHHRKLKPYQVAVVWNNLGKAVQNSRQHWEERQRFWIGGGPNDSLGKSN
jgi:hypothetical protein